jgi:MtN3 and saliva related transmembrane protein
MAAWFVETRTVHQTTVELIGYIAATCTTLSFLPQLIRVVRLRSARDISLGMFVIFSFGTIMWLLYGLFAHSAPVAVANFVTLLLSLAILVLKLRFDAQERRSASLLMADATDSDLRTSTGGNAISASILAAAPEMAPESTFTAKEHR